MPEGDVVWRTARVLDSALSGRTLTDFDLRVPQLATADLVGHRVEAVVPKGKHLLLRIAPDLTLHCHLRMDGSWHVYRSGDRWTGGPGHTIRAVLGNERWLAVGYRVHDIALVARRDEHTLVGHLGPDVLGADWDVAEAVRRLIADPGRPVGEALTDQRNVAGIGNMYKSETLFLSGIDPWLPIGAIRDAGAVLEGARRLMTANLERTAQSTTGDIGRGRQHWVYQRGGQDCRRCGTRIRRSEQGPAGGERSTYWCPTCQPGPGPGPSSAGGSASAGDSSTAPGTGSRRA